MNVKMLIMGVILLVISLSSGTVENITYTLNLFTRVLRIVQDRYVEEVSPSRLVREAIEGMLQSLDPHSSFLDEDDFKELQVKTEGKFGGLGIQISIRDGWLTIIAPIEGTPAYRAGLRPGDVITEIEGESTRGITTSDAVKKLRGEPGTEVTIMIAREGMEEAEYTIERAIIEMKNVPYYGILSNDIGYIRLANFSKGASEEISDAISALQILGKRSLILDLRGNAGGLLTEAIRVSDNFIDKNRMIVSTRGKIAGANREYIAERELAYGRYPLVVLVNMASASASEIVAGAVQDWSRGLVIGDTTFGKGSVQTVVPMGRMEALRLTTARHYTPSGRCIDRSDTLRFLLRNPTVGMKFTTLEEPFRTLCGGGGIVPDISIEPERTPPLLGRIWRKGGFLSFAAYYTRQFPNLERGWTFDEQIYDEFKTFLIVNKEMEIKESEWDEAIPFVEKHLRGAIAEALWGKEGRYEESVLIFDPLIIEAKRLLLETDTLDELFAEIGY